ncbi:hypothetical protein CLAIMM_06135, partial [Cladophialophora immunda]
MWKRVSRQPLSPWTPWFRQNRLFQQPLWSCPASRAIVAGSKECEVELIDSDSVRILDLGGKKVRTRTPPDARHPMCGEHVGINVAGGLSYGSLQLALMQLDGLSRALRRVSVEQATKKQRGWK